MDNPPPTATFTPGWNDPPQNVVSTGTKRMQHKRLVDPSIQGLGGNNSYSPYQQQSSQMNPQSYTASPQFTQTSQGVNPQQQQQFYQQQSTPQHNQSTQWTSQQQQQQFGQPGGFQSPVQYQQPTAAVNFSQMQQPSGQQM